MQSGQAGLRHVSTSFNLKPLFAIQREAGLFQGIGKLCVSSTIEANCAVLAYCTLVQRGHDWRSVHAPAGIYLRGHH
jgi:hypothetical protein